MKSIRTLLALVLIALANLPSLASSQSITLGPTPRQVFCAGDEFQLGYTASGYSSSKNSFVVQLSGSSGSFATFQTIGTLRTTASGVITAKIPTDIVSGTAFRLRVISTDPYVVSDDNGVDLTIGGIPVPRMDEGASYRGYHAMVGEEMVFTHHSSNAVSVRWSFGPDATPETSTEASPRVTFSSPGFKEVMLTAISAGGCEVTSLQSLSNSETHDGVLVYVGSCHPKIPSGAKIDSFESSFGLREGGAFWVVPGGTHSEFGPEYSEFFVEPGGTVHSLSYFNILYLKAGAALVEPHRSSFVIYEQGASVDEGYRGIIKRECNELEFDYSVAPHYKIQQAGITLDKKPAIHIYPNPASDFIYRSNTTERLLGARLFNITGACVSSVVEPVGRELMAVRSLPPGLYNLELQFEDAIIFEKILVQH